MNTLRTKHSVTDRAIGIAMLILIWAMLAACIGVVLYRTLMIDHYV